MVKVLGNLDDTFFDIVDLPETEIKELFPDYDSDSFRLNQTIGDGIFFTVPLKQMRGRVII